MWFVKLENKTNSIFYAIYIQNSLTDLLYYDRTKTTLIVEKKTCCYFILFVWFFDQKQNFVLNCIINKTFLLKLISFDKSNKTYFFKIVRKTKTERTKLRLLKDSEKLYLQVN